MGSKVPWRGLTSEADLLDEREEGLEVFLAGESPSVGRRLVRDVFWEGDSILFVSCAYAGVALYIVRMFCIEVRASNVLIYCIRQA